MTLQNHLISEQSIKGRLEGRSLFKTLFFPLSFEGEGDKGGEVDSIPFN